MKARHELVRCKVQAEFGAVAAVWPLPMRATLDTSKSIDDNKGTDEQRHAHTCGLRYLFCGKFCCCCGEAGDEERRHLVASDSTGSTKLTWVVGGGTF